MTFVTLRYTLTLNNKTMETRNFYCECCTHNFTSKLENPICPECDSQDTFEGTDPLLIDLNYHNEGSGWDD